MTAREDGVPRKGNESGRTTEPDAMEAFQPYMGTVRTTDVKGRM